MQYALDSQYFVGPLHSHMGSQAAGVIIQEIRDSQLIQIDVWDGQHEAVSERLRALCGMGLPERPCRASHHQDVRLLWLGPGRYWLVAPSDSEAVDKVLAEFADGGRAVCIDLSHSRVRLRLSGPQVRAWLAKGLPIDLHPRAFAVDTVISSAIDHVGVTLDRVDAAPAYDLYVFRGFAVSLMDYFHATSAEFGAELR